MPTSTGFLNMPSTGGDFPVLGLSGLQAEFPPLHGAMGVKFSFTTVVLYFRISSWSEDNRQYRPPDRGHAITSQAKAGHYRRKISSDHAGRWRLALLKPIVFIPGTIDLKEAHREVEVSRKAMRIVGWHGTLPYIEANHQVLK